MNAGEDVNPVPPENKKTVGTVLCPLFQYNNPVFKNAGKSVIRLQFPCGTKPVVGQPDGLVSQQSTPIVGIPVIDKGHSRVLIMFVNLR